MTMIAKAIAIAALLSASAAMAQTDAQAGHQQDKPSAQAGPAKPDAERRDCHMMKGMMARGPAGEAAKGKEGARERADRMKCMSREKTAANDDHGHDHPQVKAK